MTATQAILDARITCPDCGYTTLEQMPTNACRYFYDCDACHITLRPLPCNCCLL